VRGLIALLLASIALAGCGGDSSSSGTTGKYPKQVEQNFLRSCTAQPKANKAYCQCALSKIEDKLSYEDFKKADQAISGLNGAPAKAKRAFQSAVAGCRGKL
jgi:hypothetical protein